MAARLATTPCAKPANWQLRTTGKAGHSDGIFNDQMGSGAVYEISRIISEFQLTLREPNMTFHVGMLLGGANPKADPSGAGAHAPGESVDVESIPRQAKRAALLIRRLAQ